MYFRLKNALLFTFALALATLLASVLGQPTATAPAAPVYERLVEIWYNSTNCDNSTAIAILGLMYVGRENAWRFDHKRIMSMYSNQYTIMSK